MIVSVDSARFKIIFKQEFIVRTFKKKNLFLFCNTDNSDLFFKPDI